MTAYITMMAAAVLVLLPLYLLVRWLYRRKKHIRPTPGREVILALFVLFCGGLAILLFDGFSPWHYALSSIAQVLEQRFATGQDINLVPFKSIQRYVVLMGRYGTGTDIFTTNLVGNVAMLIPIGFGLPLLWQRWHRWWKMLLLSLVLPICFETFQLILPRSVDIDDVLLNMAGILLGWGVYLLLRRIWPGIKKIALPPGSPAKAPAT